MGNRLIDDFDQSAVVGYDEWGRPLGVSGLPLSDPLANATGRVVGAFGEGLAGGFGDRSLGLSPEVQNKLQGAGLLGAVMNTLAPWGDLAFRTASGLLGAYQSGMTQVGEELGQPQLGRDLAALPEAFPFGFSGGMPQSPAPKTLSSKHVLIYDPPSTAARPFSADYPAGAPADATGRLLTDIDGRPLSAPYVAGRTVVGAPDQAVPPEGFDAIAEGITGKGISPASPRQLGGDAGRLVTTRNPQTGAVERTAFVRNDLGPSTALKVGAHEVGHAIDEVAGQISTKGLDAELAPLYNTLNNGNKNPNGTTYGPRATPTTGGYSGAEVPREKIAEAIRGYMTDPNWLKTIAPQTAARIRAAVNAHPTLSKVIQFNSAAAALSPFTGIWEGSGNTTGQPD